MHVCMYGVCMHVCLYVQVCVCMCVFKARFCKGKNVIVFQVWFTLINLIITHSINFLANDMNSFLFVAEENNSLVYLMHFLYPFFEGSSYILAVVNTAVTLVIMHLLRLYGGSFLNY